MSIQKHVYPNRAIRIQLLDEDVMGETLVTCK